MEQTKTTEPKGKTSRMFDYVVAGCFAPIVVLLLGNCFLSLVAALHGDTKTHTISGPASLDSPNMPWYLHWQHELMSNLLLLWIVCIALGALIAFLRGPRADDGGAS